MKLIALATGELINPIYITRVHVLGPKKIMVVISTRTAREPTNYILKMPIEEFAEIFERSTGGIPIGELPPV
jgi:hypothetical protein